MSPCFADGRWQLGLHPVIMGILNVTPDSFSDGGRYAAPDAAVDHALEMARAGADIIDIGGQSTRPGAAKISAAEEIARLTPVLERLRGRVALPLSVDTFYPEVAAFALTHGVDIVNDVSGLPTAEMATHVRENRAGWIVMHNPGGQSGATDCAAYPDGVVAAVSQFFAQAKQFAHTHGVDEAALCFDPGFGFCKTLEEHALLLGQLDEVNEGIGCTGCFSALIYLFRKNKENVPKKLRAAPMLVGLSRKRFVRELYGCENERELDIASAALHHLACTRGAGIIRTHNVALTRRVLDGIQWTN
ncbi:MAG: dihydropteroate synthase [Oscillospiraceae bacterium]|jgi:dihydropteroate synthase|nr:dihydropteroate synthase [Oscillospiraceae bacterium]